MGLVNDRELSIGFVLSTIKDWLDKEQECYEKEMKEEKQVVYYFAYGATICQELFESKIGKVECISKAALAHFRLHFSKIYRNAPSMAMVVPEKDAQVEGVIYKITKAQLNRLDSWKGHSRCMERRQFYLKSDSSDLFALPIEVYIAKQEQPYTPPHFQYMQFMMLGADKLGLSHEYKKQLWRHAIAATGHSKL